MTKSIVPFQTIENTIGKTPLVRLAALSGEENEKRNNVILAKLEGSNPSGSIKDRIVSAIVRYAEERGEISPGDMLIEAANGNAGIALAMMAAKKGYGCTLVMPEDTSMEKQQCMAIYGAKIILTPGHTGMSVARDLVRKMVEEGQGVTLDLSVNPDNPRAHYETTGPEIWYATAGLVTHVVCGMGSTGTITGVSRYLKEMNPDIQIIGVEPEIAGRIPGLQKWSVSGVRRAWDAGRIDSVELVSLAHAEHMVRRMAKEEGFFCGISSAAACHVTLQLSREVEGATMVFVASDRGDRYLSMGMFPA